MEFIICYLFVLISVLFFLLQVTVSDEGTPTLSSTTRVIVNVEDVNDHAPEFREKYLKALIPALADSSVFQVHI
jgi:protocadherin Fat 1/2/3